MSKSKLNLLTIGYAKQALVSETREHERMRRYASVLGELHMIVFTKRKDGLPTYEKVDNLHIYGTNARTRIGVLWRAIVIGRHVLRQNKNKKFVVSSQDPFETAVVGGVVAFGNHATNHIQMHGDLLNPLSYQASLLSRLRYLVGLMMLKRVSVIRVVSERIKRSLKPLNLKAEVNILPIQADLDSFLRVGRTRVYRSENPSFLYVGRFAEEKNIPLLIKSFATVVKEFPKITLSLVGSGAKQEEINDLIKKYQIESRCHILPWAGDVSAVMARHDVLCLSSDHEGWGMVLAEAMASGMALVTTDVGCSGEVVQNHAHGLVVPVRNEGKYTEAMRQYCLCPKLLEQNGKASYQKIIETALTEEEYLHKLVDSFTSS